MKRAAFMLALFFAGLPLSAIAQPALGNAQFDTLCGTFRMKLEAVRAGTKIPGVTAAFTMPDGRVCAAAAGSTRISGGRKLATDDPILAGSIGKTFVSALALQLVEEGKLDLNTKIEHWLRTKPWFPRLPNAHDVTVRSLMNHTSGLPNHVDEKSFLTASTRRPSDDVSYDYLLSFIFDKKPRFAVGQGYLYSDTDYVLLAMIEEEITKSTMYDEVTRRFLKPLKLDHTSPAIRNLDPAVYGYHENKPVVKNGLLIINPQWEYGGGGFWSTPTDLARWAKALYGGSVLKKETLDQLINGTSVGDGKAYGLGVELMTTRWGKAQGHDGEWPGYLSVMRYYPRFDVAVALQYNAGGTPETYAFGENVDDLAAVFIDEMLTDKLSFAERAELEKLVTAWLGRIDKRELAASWDDLSKELKAKYTREKWPEALKPLINQVGAIKSRSLRSAVRLEADAVTVSFASSFSKAPSVNETVRLKLEDGRWRISSYSIN